MLVLNTRCFCSYITSIYGNTYSFWEKYMKSVTEIMKAVLVAVNRKVLLHKTEYRIHMFIKSILLITFWAMHSLIYVYLIMFNGI